MTPLEREMLDCLETILTDVELQGVPVTLHAEMVEKIRAVVAKAEAK